MHFIYVDESGDPGKWDPSLPQGKRPSAHYLLTGVIVPAGEWRTSLTTIVGIRRALKETYGLPVRAELHGAQLINPRGDSVFATLGSRHTRVGLYRDFLRQSVAGLPGIRVINIYAHKPALKPTSVPSGDIQLECWTRLLQRYHNFLSKVGVGQAGIVFSDDTNEPKVRKLLRKMRVFNHVPSYYGGFYADPAITILEDVTMRQSSNSYFVQLADMIAHALYRQEQRKGSLRRYGVNGLFRLVDAALLKKAAPGDIQGVVRV